jgi:hypothetical protein
VRVAGVGRAGVDSSVSAPSRALKVFGSILAPTTVLTALLFHFGTQHANWFCEWFAVNYTALGLSPQDYLIRSSDGMFVPLTVVSVAGLILLWGYRLLEARLSPKAWRALLRRLVPTAVVLGLGLVALGLTGIVDTALLYRFPGLPGLCIAVGFVLLPLAERLHQLRVGGRPAPTMVVIQWVLTFVLVSIGLFWSVTDYSSAVGQTRGYEFETKLATMSETVVFSTKDLGVRAPGVTRTTCTGADYKFRYDGFVLVLQSSGQYFLLPRQWNRQDGVALLLARGNDVRLEFSPNSSARAREC